MKKSKYVVITGASSGIGYATAKAFAEREKNLILIARRKEKLLELKNEIIAIHPELDIIVKSIDLSIEKNLYQLFDDLNDFEIETWINNAGFGYYSQLAEQDIQKTVKMIRLNVEALTILSMLFVEKYQNVTGTQLINVSSAGGYTIVPTAITYCGTKFFVSSFTEGLARELMDTGAKMRAKVLAPAATKTEFGKVANDLESYDYDKAFETYHSSDQMAHFLLDLYDSDKTVGHINRETFTFELSDGLFNYSDNSSSNQKP
ncbi:hypothetical protein RV02_GL002953 [Enterococcus gilvus]|uniref:Oxidoreductase n=2 Tax=Enterococcus gilvus TaxID=160453 RepID=R2XLP1_9ENTE|nr:SDR family NAD(P)-dependent oxidoreductase [Enterococcus gilvus]EOI55453.1 hypothetical protein UKC_02661 [Enterococcus gilvus ATCC BAA-350]EOW82004.1 hypothetical protein I592_01305 [Enterococcus gilvus ATCC BAA-350]OJG43033.1 hypothetical protein RV02_GL002953 [Enterococcus gilvus]